MLRPLADELDDSFQILEWRLAVPTEGGVVQLIPAHLHAQRQAAVAIVAVSTIADDEWGGLSPGSFDTGGMRCSAPV